MAVFRPLRSLGLASLAVVAALPFSAACRPPTNTPSAAGEPWEVSGALRSNACAPGLDPIDPLVFGAEIRREGSLAYWRIGEQPWIGGTLDRTGRFHFTVRGDVELYPATHGTDPELDPGTPGCTVTMIETIDGTITDASPADAGTDVGADAAASNDAGTDVGPAEASATFTATNRIELVPQVGSDCSRALSSAGGPFPSLPCAAEYALTGARL